MLLLSLEFLLRLFSSRQDTILVYMDRFLDKFAHGEFALIVRMWSTLCL